MDEDAHQHDVLDDVREVPGMKSVAIVHAGSQSMMFAPLWIRSC
jgi:hypothetical protein